MILDYITRCSAQDAALRLRRMLQRNNPAVFIYCGTAIVSGEMKIAIHSDIELDVPDTFSEFNVLSFVGGVNNVRSTV